MTEIISFKPKTKDLGIWRYLTRELLDEFTFADEIPSQGRRYQIPKTADYWLGFESSKRSKFRVYFMGQIILEGEGDLKVEIPIVPLFGNIVLEFQQDPGQVKNIFKCVDPERREKLATSETIILEELNLIICAGYLKRIYC